MNERWPLRYRLAYQMHGYANRLHRAAGGSNRFTAWLNDKAACLWVGWWIRRVTESTKVGSSRGVLLMPQSVWVKTKLFKLRPKMIKTIAQLDALPDRVVVIDRTGTVWEKDNQYAGADEPWWSPGTTPFGLGSDQIALPARVIHMPES